MAAYMKLGDIKGQAADAPGDAASDAFAFGPAMDERVAHPRNQIVIDARAGEIHLAANPAHELSDSR